MTSISDLLDSINPSNNSTGVPLNSSITVLFDREIDEWSIEHGGFILEGPDTDQVIYPGYAPTPLANGSEQEILLSAGYKGLVPGVFTFSRVSLSNSSLVNTSDTTGDGTLFRTRAIFKPSQPLAPLTEYTLYLVGDDDLADQELFGIRSRTVFDVVSDPGNSGNGTITFSGTYLGTLSNDVVNIRITTAGVPGVAEFESWKDSAPLDLIGPFLTSSTESEVIDGVTVQFLSGTFQINDTFTVAVKRPEVFTGTSTLSFTTGNGSISVVPTTTSTSITGSPISTTTTEFKLVKATPMDGATNLDPSSSKRIIVEFNDDIDPATITTNSVQVNIEPVSDHPLLTNQVSAGPISNTVTVSGHKLFIDL